MEEQYLVNKNLKSNNPFNFLCFLFRIHLKIQILFTFREFPLNLFVLKLK